MDGMDMSLMSSVGPFVEVNKRYAHAYWYAIAGSVTLLIMIRWSNMLLVRIRHYQWRRRHTNDFSIPSRPRTWPGQIYATTTALVREVIYPQPFYSTGTWKRYLTPLSSGQCLLLLAYWALLLGFLWTNVILPKGDPLYGYKWEKPAYRAGWMSAAQIPFVYLLSAKFNLVTLLTGISYERLNWLHRWTARTVFLTIIMHWAYFFHEWRLAHFVKMELDMMPMVKYGFGAWSVIGWMVLSGLGFFRAKCYEIFVAQHIVAAGVLLWLLYVHLPAYAQYHVWMSAAFVLVDWAFRIFWNVNRNLQLKRGNKLGIGFEADLERLPGGVVRVSVKGVDFAWKASQHVYLSLPRLRPLELHPFTIANDSSWDARALSASGIELRVDYERKHKTLELCIKAKSGFSKALYEAASANRASSSSRLALISGPWGEPPDMSHYDSVLLIACASGASFTIPLLQNLVLNHGCVRRLVFHWIVRQEEHTTWFEKVLREIIEYTMSSNNRQPLEIEIHVHVTNTGERALAPIALTAPSTASETDKPALVRSLSSASTDRSDDEKTALHAIQHDNHGLLFHAHFDGVRPTVDSLIRPTVEAAYGETAVVVCGGQEISAQARNYVAFLSDERAVHKGSGAQGIYLFCESFAW